MSAGTELGCRHVGEVSDQTGLAAACFAHDNHGNARPNAQQDQAHLGEIVASRRLSFYQFAAGLCAERVSAQTQKHDSRTNRNVDDILQRLTEFAVGITVRVLGGLQLDSSKELLDVVVDSRVWLAQDRHSRAPETMEHEDQCVANLFKGTGRLVVQNGWSTRIVVAACCDANAADDDGCMMAIPD